MRRFGINKIHQYNEMMRYLTRPKEDPSIKQLAKQIPQYGSPGTYGESFFEEDMPNIQDLIREEGIQVGPQVKDGGRIYDTRKYFKPGGLVEPGVTHYSKYTDTEAAQKYGDLLKGRKWSELTDKVKSQIKSLFIWQKKNPGGTTKFKTLTIGGKEFNLPATLFKGGDDSQWRAAVKFLENWKQNPTVENYVTLLNDEDKTTQSLLKRIRNYYTGGKSHPGKDNIVGGDTKKILDALKVDKTILNADELKEFKRYTRKVTQPVRAVIQATPGSAKKALYKSAENVIKINNIFKANPSITLNALTSKIHGKDFARAGDAGKLEMATKVSDDVAKYLEAISKTTEGEVARVIPRGLKTQWSPPTGKNLKNIMEYIRSQSKGFRFREGTLRNYKYSIRDSLMKLPPGTTRNLENRLKGIKGVLDHAVGLSATFDVAPGYTEAFQILEKSVNDAKGIGVDREFGPALRAALQGDFSKVDAYNETAALFQKNNPGVDVPFIEKGGDPRKTVKYFDQFSPAAQKNILEVAQKGVAIKTGAMPLTEETLKTLLQTAKKVKGPKKIQAVTKMIAILGSGKLADEYLKKQGINLTQDENEKVLEASMFPGDLIKEHPVTSALGAAATLRASKSVPGDPLKKVRRLHKLVSTPLKKLIRSAGTPLAGAGFAGWRIHDELKAGKSLTDAVVDPIVGAELALPSLFKENISKIIPDKYQNVAARAGRKLLGLGKVGSRFMGPVGVAIGATGSVYDAYKDYQRRKEFLTPERIAEAQKEKFDVDEPMFKSGGRVPFVKGKLVLADKGRRAFMKWLAGITGATVAAGTGLLKFGKTIGKGKTVVKAGDHIIQGTPGMPDWYIPLVNRIVKEGDDVTAKLATKEREIVHTKKIEGHDVDVYQDLDTGNIRVEVEGGTGKHLTAYDEGLSLEYKAGEVIEEGTMKGQKTTPEFNVAETEARYYQVGPDDAELEFEHMLQGQPLKYDKKKMTYVVDESKASTDEILSDTNFLKNYAKKKKPNMGQIVETTKKKKYNKHLSDNPHEDPRIPEGPEPDYDDYLPDIDDMDY